MTKVSTAPKKLRIGLPNFPRFWPVTLDEPDERRHIALIGLDAHLRRSHIASLLSQQTHRGGWIVLMLDEDRDMLACLAAAALAANRLEEFHVIDLARPGAGHAYDPLFHASPRTAASRVSRLALAARANDYWAHFGGDLLFPLFDFAARRGANLTLPALSAVLEDPRRFIPQFMLDPVAREALQRLGFDSTGVVRTSEGVGCFQALATGLPCVVRSGQLGGFDTGRSQVCLQAVAQRGEMCCIVLPHRVPHPDGITLLIDDLNAAVASRQWCASCAPFLLAFTDIEAWADLVDPGQSGGVSRVAGLLQTLEQGRAAGVGALVGCAELGMPYRRAFADTLRGNTGTKIWHPAISSADVRLAEMLHPRLADTLHAAKLAGFTMLSHGKVTVGRIPCAPAGSPAPWALPGRKLETKVELDLGVAPPVCTALSPQ